MSDRTLAERHRYVTEHGRPPAIGVTTVIKIVGIPGLPWAAAQIAARSAVLEQDRAGVTAEHRAMLVRKGKWIKGLPDETVKVRAAEATDAEIYVHYLRSRFDFEWTAKADLGTRVHDAAEKLSRGENVEVLSTDRPYIDAWFRFYEECKPEFIDIERVVLSPNPNGNRRLEYGGRTDWTAILHGGKLKGLRLGDYKTGGHYEEPVALQAAAYGGAEGFATYDQMGRLAGLEPIPKLDGYVTIYLAGDGSYQAIDPFINTTFARAKEHFLVLRSYVDFHRSFEDFGRN